MNTTEIDQLLGTLKPAGHHCNPLVTELHRLAQEIQRQTDQAHAAVQAVRSPEFKGDVVGELVEWWGHFPLELDHSEGRLNDILVRGVSVSDHLAPGLFDEAEEYIQQRHGREPTPAARRRIDRMDAADLHAERAA